MMIKMLRNLTLCMLCGKIIPEVSKTAAEQVLKLRL